MNELQKFDRQEELFGLLSKEVSDVIRKCKFLFIENRTVYVSMVNLSNEEIDFLRKNWVKQVKNALSIMEINWKNVSLEEEKILLLEKALEIMKAKEVKVSLA